MSSSQVLGIELALTAAGESFINKYNLMKHRLLNVEYEHWAAGFPEGNNHGRGHIVRVLEYLDLLLGAKPLEHLDEYELFLMMMSVLYHDIGILQQRKGHENISKALLEEDANDAYIINRIDKEIIAAAVVSHSSNKDIAAECARFSPEEIIGKHKARPAVVAALVRLADELDEDHRRADPILQQRLNLPDESRFFWLFCERVRGIRPNLNAKRIDFNLAIEKQDTELFGPVPGGRIRHFIVFMAEKLAKINQERVKVNRFLPPELQYAGIHVDVKPLRNHPKWKAPRTFVFNDYTTAEMLLQSYPELLHEPANEAMEGILELMRQRKLDTAEGVLDRLASVLTDLPMDVQMRIFYGKACVYSMKAMTLLERSREREEALDQAAKYLIDWFDHGQKEGFKTIGRTSVAEVHRMASDADLALVRAERNTILRKAIPESNWPTPGSGGGCVALGALIDIPEGKCGVERLRPGDDVISLTVESPNERVRAKVTAVRSTQSASCIRLNGTWLITPAQPVLTPVGWVEAQTLKNGDMVMDGSGSFVPIRAIQIIDAYFEVFDLTIDSPEHNYIANGLLCHNKLPTWYQELKQMIRDGWHK